MLDRSEIGKRGYLHEPYRLFHLRDDRALQLDYHYHEFDKLVLLLGGRIVYHIEGRSYPLQPLDVLLVSRNLIHQPVVEPGVPYERMVLWIDRDFMARYSGPGANLADCFTLTAGRLYIVSTEEEPPAGRRPLVVLLSRFPLFQFHFLPHIPRILFPDCIRHIGVKGRIPGPLDRFPHTGFHAFRQGQFHSVIRLITVFLLCGCSRRPPGRRVFLFISHKKAPLSTVPHYSTLRTFTVV